MKSILQVILSCTVLLAVACKKTAADAEKRIEEPVLQKVDNPSATNSALPRLFSNGEEIFMSWVTESDSTSTLKYATYEDGAWSPSKSIISGNDWFVNWADFPVIAENNGNILTSFLQKSANGTYTYDIKLNLYSSVNGQWKNNFILHQDGTKSEHGFVSIRPYGENSFVVSWLDGRDTAGKSHGGGQMTLRAAVVHHDGTIDYDTQLDERVCDCCQTSIAVGPEDEIYVAYRDRGPEEMRDISFIRWNKDKASIESQTLGNDNWKIAGCPVNGPSMSNFGNTVVVAWFTATNGEGKVQLAFSEDRGTTFGKPVRIDAGNATGRVDIVMLDNENAAVLWMEPHGEQEHIQLMKVSTSGVKSQPITVSKTSAERGSGFPQLSYVKGDIMVVWTNRSANKSQIMSAMVKAEYL